MARINVVLLNTLIKLYTAMISVLKATPCLSSQLEVSANRCARSSSDRMLWTTVKTTSSRWEADLMQQVLAAHEIQAHILDLGIGSYMGQGSPAALQVQAADEQLAILLLSVVDETTEASE